MVMGVMVAATVLPGKAKQKTGVSGGGNSPEPNPKVAAFGQGSIRAERPCVGVVCRGAEAPAGASERRP